MEARKIKMVTLQPMSCKAFAIPLLLLAATALSSFTRERDGKRAEAPFPAVCKFRNTPDTVTLRFIGDVMLHTAQIGRDYGTFLKGIEDDLRNADVSVGNMEFTLGGAPYTGYPAFSSPDAYAEYARQAGIDIFLTANNHILDRGVSGLERTLDKYTEFEKDAGFAYTGSGRTEDSFMKHNPLFFRAKGIRIAIVNCTYGTNVGPVPGYPRVAVLEDACALIREASRKGADIIIAMPHWGTEYKTANNRVQRDWARKMAECGADIIIGAHPHVVQNMELLEVFGDDGRQKTVPVFYSIGNAVSNMSAPDTQAELMITLRLVRGTDGSVEMLDPGWDWLWCTLPGRLTDNYMTIKIKDYIGTRRQWKNPCDYDKMISTWKRMEAATGLY